MVNLYSVNGRWMTKDQAIEARGLKKKDPQEEVEEIKPEPDTQVEDVENAESKTEDISELEALKRECDEKGIKYHHKSGVKKLKELLEAAKQ